MVTSPTVSFTLLKLKSMAMHISPSGKAGGQSISCRVISAEFTSTDVMGHTSDGFEDDDGALLKLGAEGSSDGLVGSEEGLEDGFEDEPPTIMEDGGEETDGIEVLPQSIWSYFRLMVATD
jgi:hypothetical protein